MLFKIVKLWVDHLVAQVYRVKSRVDVLNTVDDMESLSATSSGNMTKT